jgi:hypothetical protein
MNPKLSYIIEHDEPGRARDCEAAGERPGILISGESGWEFRVEPFEAASYDGNVTRATKIVIFSDAYTAFTEIRDFFSLLAAYPHTTLHDVQALLDALGAADVTRRT